jgi:hypothetical protein
LRLEREARTLAALNHPNTAAIYGIEQAGSVTALILERLREVGSAIVEIEEARLPTPDVAATPPVQQPHRLLFVAGLAISAAAAITGGVWVMTRPTPMAAVSRFEITLPTGTDFSGAGRHLVALSPDGAPTQVFSLDGFLTLGGAWQYTIAPDGRFIMLKDASLAPKRDTAGSARLVLVQNWFEELKQRVPAN